MSGHCSSLAYNLVTPCRLSHFTLPFMSTELDSTPDLCHAGSRVEEMHRVQSSHARHKPLGSLLFIPALIGGGAIGYFVSEQRSVSLADIATLFNTFKPGCNIKGNVTINSGERIYHVPGQKLYTATIIRPEFGERWFCSEGEARTAGWLKAKR